MRGKRTGQSLAKTEFEGTANANRALYQHIYYRKKLQVLHPTTRQLVEDGTIGLKFAYNLSIMKDVKLRKTLEYLLKQWFRENNMNLVLYKLMNLIRERSNVVDLASNIISGKAVPNPIEPCKTLGVCPYGALVKQFELNYGKDACSVYHRTCPYFVVAEPIPIK